MPRADYSEPIRGLTSSPGTGLMYAPKFGLAANPGPPDKTGVFANNPEEY